MKNKEQKKAIKFAKVLARIIWDLSYEGDFFFEDFSDTFDRPISKEYMLGIMETPIHKKIILKELEANMLKDISKHPESFKNHKDKFAYRTEDMEYDGVILQYIKDLFEEENPYLGNLFFVGAEITTNGLNMFEITAVTHTHIDCRDLRTDDEYTFLKTEHKFELAEPKEILKALLVEAVEENLGADDDDPVEAAKEIIDTMSNYLEKFL